LDEGVKEEDSQEDASEPDGAPLTLNQHSNPPTPPVPSDYDAVLEELAARSASNGNGQLRLCDHCGTPGKLNPWDWPHRPDGIVLHSSCEGPWFDSEGRRQ
jgi:hypothetical protein